MARIVGNRNRSEFILDPAEALRRGKILDGMLLSARPPVQAGITRATHRVLNELDDNRQLAAARRLNRR